MSLTTIHAAELQIKSTAWFKSWFYIELGAVVKECIAITGGILCLSECIYLYFAGIRSDFLALVILDANLRLWGYLRTSRIFLFVVEVVTQLGSVW